MIGRERTKFEMGMILTSLIRRMNYKATWVVLFAPIGLFLGWVDANVMGFPMFSLGAGCCHLIAFTFNISEYPECRILGGEVFKRQEQLIRKIKSSRREVLLFSLLPNLSFSFTFGLLPLALLVFDQRLTVVYLSVATALGVAFSGLTYFHVRRFKIETVENHD